MIRDAIERAKAFLFLRKKAYTVVFSSDSTQARVVLRDLARFCRAHQTTFHQNERAHALMEGRREVWLRISEHLNLTEERLWELYGKKE